jgi:5-enolpyruvylshikimate-3-phosphate synthase
MVVARVDVRVDLVVVPSLQVYLSGSVSSQYLTALLMAAPLATGTEGIEIIIKDELVGEWGSEAGNE